MAIRSGRPPVSELITLASLPEITVDVAGLDAAASDHRREAALVGPAAESAHGAWQGLEHSYETPERWELVAKMSVVRTAGQDFTDGLGSVADALATCAQELAGAERRLELLHSEVTALRAAVSSYRLDQAEMLDVDASDTSDAWGPGQYLWHAELLSERESIRTLIETSLEQARSDLTAVSAPVGLGDLADGSSADASALATSWTSRQDVFEADLSMVMLMRLASDDPERVEALSATHPEWMEHLREQPPEPDAVRRWWDSLGAGDGSGGPWSATQRALVLGAPVIVGALGGVPPLARVEANRGTARRELDATESELERLREEAAADEASGYRGYSYGHVPDAAERAREERMEELQQQIDYLTRATTPRDDGSYAVQLYLYDPERSRIVEMFGTPSEETTTTVTYSPGTGTTVDSFHGGGVQQVARWLTDQDAGTVAFVWKDGEFPGGILEANDTDFALDAGERLARFQTEVHSDPHLGSTYDVGIGHSWGLAAVTSSEVGGAGYDQVESLAGAYVPPGWEADPDTQYSHQTYRDFLSIFQDMGVVGEGRNPDVTEPFASSTYDRPGDFTWYLPDGSSGPGGISVPSGPPPGIDVTTSPVENHSLIASDNAENLFVLDAIEARREKGASHVDTD